MRSEILSFTPRQIYLESPIWVVAINQKGHNPELPVYASLKISFDFALQQRYRSRVHPRLERVARLGQGLYDLRLTRRRVSLMCNCVIASVLTSIGIVPSIILILGLGIIATYTGYVIGQFKLAYPHVHNMVDAGEVTAGRIGREVFGAGQILFLVFVMGSHILTFSIMMNTVTSHGTCTIVFSIVGMIVCLVLTLPRTQRKVSYMAIASFISILSAVMITMIGVDVERPGSGKVDVTVKSSFYKGFEAVTNIIFAYSGHVAFFSFISELRTPESYPKALFLLQGVDISMYLTVAIVTYGYAGTDVVSPALGPTSPLLRKIAYGIAIPTLVIAGVTNGHVASKYIYVRLYRGTDRMGQRTWLSFGIWAAIVLVLWTIAWIIAEVIPVFNDLLSLIGALSASWFTYGLSGVFWLYLNWGRYGESKRKMFLTGVNMGTFVIGLTICALGLYSSGTAIHKDATSANGSFSCADNASS
ncbi:transmembrane amino acid transporter protein-domain-containing protein [Usnea florida]